MNKLGLSLSRCNSCGISASCQRDFGDFCRARQKLLAQRVCEASRAKKPLADFAPAKTCLSIRTKFANLQLWVTPQVPKPSPKRDRVITKATAVSPLSPRCQPEIGRASCRERVS